MRERIKAAFKSVRKSDGIDLIATERYEQVAKHNRTIVKDVDENNNFELREAAVAMLEGNLAKIPAKWDAGICVKMVGKSYVERLAIAGAFCAAEIDRIQALEMLKQNTTV